MNFNQAYFTIVNASIQQDTKEIPLILSVTDFNNNECLEIGAGPLARLAVKIIKKSSPKHITCLEIYEPNVNSIQEIIKQNNLENKITAVLSKEKSKLPFSDNSFDIIYAGWIPSSLLKNPDYLEELSRVSKKDIILIMSGTSGDIPPMVDLIEKQNEKDKRLKTKEFLIDYFLSKGYKVDAKKEATLQLRFKDTNEAFEVFHCFDFNNSLDKKQQIILKAYLTDKYDKFKDNLYIFHAWKK